MLFPDVFEKGDRLLGKEWGCDHKTVGKIRNVVIERIERGDISPPARIFEVEGAIQQIKEIIDKDIYIGLDGKKYPRTKVLVPAAEESGKGKTESPKKLVAEWNTEWLPKVADIFIERGVSQNSVRANISRAIDKEFGDIPYSLSDKDLSTLINDAKIIINNPQRDKWHREDHHGVLWADNVLAKAPTTLDQWTEMVKAQIKTWKKKREGCGHASLSMFLKATLKYHSLPSDTECDEEIYEKLMHLLTTRRTNILEVLVKRQLRGEDEQSAHSTTEEVTVFDVYIHGSDGKGRFYASKEISEKFNVALKSSEWDADKLHGIADQLQEALYNLLCYDAEDDQFGDAL